MSVAKGRILANYDYEYTCGNCQGRGTLPNGDECTHCYNLDYDKLLIAFRASQGGERYWALWKAILSIKGGQMARDIRAKDHKAVMADLVHLMVAYRMPRNRFKPLVEWLEECCVIRSGTYDRFKRSKLTVREMLDQLGYIEYDREEQS